MSLLQLRLKNCLQTLLDLKAGMKDSHSGFFENDFILLKECLDRIEKMELVEEEVATLENYASAFLSELTQSGNWTPINKNIQ